MLMMLFGCRYREQAHGRAQLGSDPLRVHIFSVIEWSNINNPRPRVHNIKVKRAVP
jgi:hypothetical protein